MYIGMAVQVSIRPNVLYIFGVRIMELSSIHGLCV